MNCCKNRNLSEPVAYCDFSQYVKFLYNGNAAAIEDNSCTNDLISFAQSYIWNNQGMLVIYFIYLFIYLLVCLLVYLCILGFYVDASHADCVDGSHLKGLSKCHESFPL